MITGWPADWLTAEEFRTPPKLADACIRQRPDAAIRHATHLRLFVAQRQPSESGQAALPSFWKTPAIQLPPTWRTRGPSEERVGVEE